MNAIIPRGWCPSLSAPMASGDGLLVRLRPRHAALTAAAARSIADAASRFGNGTVELTRRSALQIRGLTHDTVAPFAAATAQAGIPDDPARDRGRVVCAPLSTGVMADAIEASVAGVAGLPEKFFVAVEADGGLALGDLGADIAVVCDGAAGLVSPAGSATSVHCPARDVPRVVATLAVAAIELSAARVPARMRSVVAACGARALFEAAGVVAQWPTPNAPQPVSVGVVAPAAFGLGLPFGVCDLRALADLAEAHGDGLLHLTPWRAVILTGVRAPDDLAHRAGGMIVARDDPRRGIVACSGMPACASATVDTRATAARLARTPAIGRMFDKIHVSGCAKGCAHPDPAPLTLVGRDGRFDMVRDARASDRPIRRDLGPADLAAAIASDIA